MKRSLVIRCWLCVASAANGAGAEEPSIPAAPAASTTPALDGPDNDNAPGEARSSSHRLTDVEWHAEGAAPPVKSDRPNAPPPLREVPAPKSDWRLVGHYALINYGSIFLATIGTSFQYRAGRFVGGGLFEGASGFSFSGPTPSCLGAALLGGVGMRPSRDVRYALLAAFGYHLYSGMDAYGPEMSTPYAGARTAISGIHGNKLGHFEFGVYGDVQEDLARRRARSSDGSGQTQVIGAWRLGLGIEIGGTYDIY